MIISERAKHGLEISPVPVDLDGLTAVEVESVGQGSYLVNAAAGCNGCHAANDPNDPAHPKFLGGGTKFDLGPSGIIVYARNLTPDPTDGLKLTEAEFIESLQTGKDFNDSSGHHSLIVMPWASYRWMSSLDLRRMYAYLKRIPAVANTPTPDVKPAIPARPLVKSADGRILFDEGDVQRSLPPEVDTDQQPIPDIGDVNRGLAIQPLAESPAVAALPPAQQASYARGSYLVNAVAHCGNCHSNPERDQNTLKINTAGYLTGGGVRIVPSGLNSALGQVRTISADLRGETHGYFRTATFQTFLAAIEQGRHQEGTQGSLGWPMPWEIFRNMELEDLAAIYTYVKNLTPATAPADKINQQAALLCTPAQGAFPGISCPSGSTCSSTQTTGECLADACATDEDCGACQTCAGTPKKCAVPAASSTCAFRGF